MIDDEGMIYLLSSDHVSSSIVYEYGGTKGENVAVAEYDTVPTDIFRDRSGIYTVIGKELFRKGNDGDDYPIIKEEDGFSRINHV
jgi:hypothetical protein